MAIIEVIAKGHLPRVSYPSVANDKGDNEIISGAVRRSSGIYLTAEETPGKSQLGDRLMKAERPVIASNWTPYLPMNDPQLVRKGVGRKEGRKEGVKNDREGKSNRRILKFLHTTQSIEENLWCIFKISSILGQ